MNETMSVIVLRDLRPEDAPRIAALCDDWDIARMTRSIPHPYGLAQAEAYLAGLLSAPEAAAREISYAIEAPDGSGLAGCVGWKPAGPGVGDFGYWLGRSYWGAGLATASARAALVKAFEEHGVHAMTACVFQDNPASARVLEKLGFRREGACSGPSIARGGESPTWTYRLEREEWSAAA